MPTLETLRESLGGLDGRRILLRADFNVPLDAAGRIADDFRVTAALPTIRWLTEGGASVVACSHLGRPDGRPEPRYSLAPVRARLAQVAPGVELLENLRFDPGETANDDRLVQQLIEGCDGYVNDAFGASHRAHASIVGPPRYRPGAAGRLLAREAEVLLGLRAKPKQPFVAVLGGAKVSDKLGVIGALLDIADEVVIGGGMCFTFLAASGHEVGESLLQVDQIEACARLLDSGAAIRLPSDITALAPGERVVQAGVNLRPDWRGLDIGPGSAAEFSDLIAEAGTVLWNGPMGLFEDPRFAAGTKVVAQALADSRAFTVVGGGDSAAAVRQFGLDREIDHVSTGGGASLELIERGDLPGLRALRESAPPQQSAPLQQEEHHG
ncbi:phosphoglycerate kinase [Candidatus Poriferisocius sp.]|uniref:phosphoglycerate kinase n=1 Tax=Candidatus Poriferisocius sp. TaxID=3101276 RepID=UPI003B5BDB2C